MAIKKDKIVVVDIEATCWKDNKNPIGQKNEIIEVGICLYDVQLKDITHKQGIFVNTVASEISEFCTYLTTITEEQIEQFGIDFADACAILEQEYDTRNHLWASWGAYDRNMFLEHCKERRVRYPFSKKHVNLKRVFADAFGQRMGMKHALQKAKLEHVGVHHRGDDDAWNTARLMRWMLDEYGEDILKRYW